MNRQPARGIAPGCDIYTDSRNPSPAPVSKYSVETSSIASDAGPEPAWAAHTVASNCRQDGLGVGRRATLERGVRGRLDTDLTEDPALVDLAGRLDDPSEHEITKHGVALGNRLESQRPVGSTQPLPQMGRLRRRDRQHTRFDRQTELDLGLSDGAPDTVFTVRTKDTSAAYDPAIVFKFDDSERNTAG
jgi:hypothetical protein